ncbi:MAG: hypothetical protein GY833_05575 [Aestuariibacter sp.]|nr:hypothetical protein [Aestuariibacter sp.]
MAIEDIQADLGLARLTSSFAGRQSPLYAQAIELAECELQLRRRRIELQNVLRRERNGARHGVGFSISSRPTSLLHQC